MATPHACDGKSRKSAIANARISRLHPAVRILLRTDTGVLKLSVLSAPTRVYRGVDERHMQLPVSFLEPKSSDCFAGGVERAFMSTTKSPAVALDYSGGAAEKGSIFVIDFEYGSRGASIQFLSQVGTPVTAGRNG